MISKNIRLVPSKQQDNDFLQEDLMNAPDGFFMEIKVLDVLESSEDKQLLDKVCNKVRKGGKVVLNGVDGLDMCRKVFYGHIPVGVAADQFFKHIKNLHSVATLKQYFLEKKWDLKFVGLDEGRYLIEAVRQ